MLNVNQESRIQNISISTTLRSPLLFIKFTKQNYRIMVLKMKSILLQTFLLFISSFIIAQESKGEWVSVDTTGQDKVYVDISGIENFSGEDIYVWTLTEHSIPIVMESVSDKIYKTNTYYIFNTRLNKYSLLYLIYYDFSGNVLASYDYGRNTKVEIYQYNYPIWKGSIEEKVLNKCIEIIERKEKK